MSGRPSAILSAPRAARYHPSPSFDRRGKEWYGRSVSIVAYPTESFFALGVDATDGNAIRQLFRVKHRESGKPVALIAANLQQVRKFFWLTKREERLARLYWPGALTMLLKPKKVIAARVLAPTTPRPSSGRRGLIEYPRRSKRIGVRVPAHAGARHLAQQVGTPITATSANITGYPPTKSPRKVKRDFPGILIGPGRCGRATRPSTVAMITTTGVHIIRQGSLNLQPRRARVEGHTANV